MKIKQAKKHDKPRGHSTNQNQQRHIIQILNRHLIINHTIHMTAQIRQILAEHRIRFPRSCNLVSSIRFFGNIFIPVFLKLLSDISAFVCTHEGSIGIYQIPACVLRRKIIIKPAYIIHCECHQNYSIRFLAFRKIQSFGCNDHITVTARHRIRSMRIRIMDTIRFFQRTHYRCTC